MTSDGALLLDERVSALVCREYTYDVVGPFGFPASGSAELVSELDLLYVPRRRLDLDHVDVDNPFVGIPCPSARVIERATSITFGSTLARMEAGRSDIGGRATQ